MKCKFNLIFLIVLLFCAIGSQSVYSQSKDWFLRQAVRNAKLEKDFSSTAVIDRGDMSEKEIFSWFQRNVPLSSKSNQIIVSYNTPKWKWGDVRNTKTTVSYLTKECEDAFTAYYVALAQQEAERKRNDEIIKWTAIAGSTVLAIALFKTDFGKDMLLTAAKAVLGGGRVSQRDVVSNPIHKKEKEVEEEIKVEPQVDPDNCQIPRIEERDEWKEVGGLLKSHDMECIVKFQDLTYVTVTMFKLDDGRVYYGYTGILFDAYFYDTFQHAAEAAWVYEKYSLTRTVGKVP